MWTPKCSNDIMDARKVEQMLNVDSQESGHSLRMPAVHWPQVFPSPSDFRISLAGF